MYGFQSRASDSVGGKAECPALGRWSGRGDYEGQRVLSEDRSLASRFQIKNGCAVRV